MHILVHNPLFVRIATANSNTPPQSIIHTEFKHGSHLDLVMWKCLGEDVGTILSVGQCTNFTQ